MKTKPVAWIIDEKMTDCDDNFIWNTGDFPDWQVKDWIPLYTHPVKELKNIVVASATCSCGKVMEITNLQPVKELTDGEIQEISHQYHYTYNPDYVGFARAILRKAQEK